MNSEYLVNVDSTEDDCLSEYKPGVTDCNKLIQKCVNSPLIVNPAPSSSGFRSQDQKPRPWICPICKFPFKFKGNLAEHIRFHHMKGSIPCNKCPKIFSSSTILRKHMKEHAVSFNKCPHCGLHFKPSGTKQERKSYHHHLLVCKRCPQSSKTNKSVPHLVDTKRGNDCGLSNIHIENNGYLENLGADIESETLNQKMDNGSQKLRNLPETFSKSVMHTLGGNDENCVNNPLPNDNSFEKSTILQLSGGSYKQEMSHELDYTMENISCTSEWNNSKVTKCATTKKIPNLKQNPLRCEKCKLYFETEKKISTHDCLPFRCYICSTGFKQLKWLDCHITKQHMGMSNFLLKKKHKYLNNTILNFAHKCKYCNAQYDTNNDLLKHKNICHQRKMNKCEKCKVIFLSKSSRSLCNRCKMSNSYSSKLKGFSYVQNQHAFKFPNRKLLHKSKINLSLISEHVQKPSEINLHSTKLVNKSNTLLTDGYLNSLPDNNSAIVILQDRKWKCVKCADLFPHFVAVSKHVSNCKFNNIQKCVAVSEEDLFWVCTTCSSAFKEYSVFTDHKSSCKPDYRHNNLKSKAKFSELIQHFCNKCGSSFNSDISFKVHSCLKILKHVTSCYVLLKRLSFSDLFLKNVIQRTYECSFCFKTFPEEYLYTIHRCLKVSKGNVLNPNISVENKIPSHISNDLIVPFHDPEKRLSNENIALKVDLVNYGRKAPSEVVDKSIDNSRKILVKNSIIRTEVKKAYVETLPLKSIKNRSATKAVSIALEVPSGLSSDNSLKCKHCDQKFSFVKDLEIHSKKFHSNNNEAIEENVNITIEPLNVSCSGFQDNSVLSLHMHQFKKNQTNGDNTLSSISILDSAGSFNSEVNYKTSLPTDIVTKIPSSCTTSSFSTTVEPFNANSTVLSDQQHFSSVNFQPTAIVSTSKCSSPVSNINKISASVSSQLFTSRENYANLSAVSDNMKLSATINDQPSVTKSNIATSLALSSNSQCSINHQTPNTSDTTTAAISNQPFHTSVNNHCGTIPTGNSFSLTNSGCWKCALCQVIFPSSSALESHQLVAHQITSNIGQAQTFSHLQNALLNSSNIPLYKQLPSFIQSQNWRCRRCDKVFDDEPTFITHFQLFPHSQEMNNTEWGNTVGHGCSIGTLSSIAKQQLPNLTNSFSSNFSDRTMSYPEVMKPDTSNSVLHNTNSPMGQLPVRNPTIHGTEMVGISQSSTSALEQFCANNYIQHSTLYPPLQQCRPHASNFSQMSSFLSCTNPQLTGIQFPFSQPSLYSTCLSNSGFNNAPFINSQPQHFQQHQVNQSTASCKNTYKNSDASLCVSTKLHKADPVCFSITSPTESSVSQDLSASSSNFVSGNIPVISNIVSLSDDSLSSAEIPQDKLFPSKNVEVTIVDNISSPDGWAVMGHKDKDTSLEVKLLKRYICSKCYKSVYSANLLASHLTEVHKVEINGSLRVAALCDRKASS